MTGTVRKRTRRARALCATGAALGLLALAGCAGGTDEASLGAAAGGGGTEVVIGAPNTGFTPQSVNFYIGSYLGYYKQQGLRVKFENLGTPQAVLGALSSGKIDFGVLPDTNMAATAAKGQKIQGKAFYEFAYPFKYGAAVKPDSPIHSLSDLKGKTVGTDSFGQSEYNVGQVMLDQSGVAGKDVQWLATGAGVASGQALSRDRISALFYSDAGFGSILSAHIPLRFLPLPKSVPQVGGQFMIASDTIWNTKRQLATKLATAIGEASDFTLANPTAAAYVFIKQFPTTALPGQSLENQIATVELPIRLRAKLFPPPKGMALGEIDPKNFTDALSFQKLKSVDTSSLYSNSVIAQANTFDPAKIRAQAKAFKIPGIKGQVKVPAIPSGTP